MKLTLLLTLVFPSWSHCLIESSSYGKDHAKPKDENVELGRSARAWWQSIHKTYENIQKPMPYPEVELCRYFLVLAKFCGPVTVAKSEKGFAKPRLSLAGQKYTKYNHLSLKTARMSELTILVHSEWPEASINLA